MLSIDGVLFRVISTFRSDSNSHPPGLERNHGNCHSHPAMNMPFRTSFGAETPSPIATEVERRRTFAIISHPDAGKTTLTEKLLEYLPILAAIFPSVRSPAAVTSCNSNK